MSEHGTRSRYNAGCRCDDCTKANAEYVTEWRHATGRTDPARLTPPSHGISGYQRRGCRCDICRAANTAACARWRAKRCLSVALGPPSTTSRSAAAEGEPSGAGGPREQRLGEVPPFGPSRQAARNRRAGPPAPPINWPAGRHCGQPQQGE